MRAVLEGAAPGRVARLDVELDALVLAEAGRSGAGNDGGGGRVRRSLRHCDGCVCV